MYFQLYGMVSPMCAEEFGDVLEAAEDNQENKAIQAVVLLLPHYIRKR